MAFTSLLREHGLKDFWKFYGKTQLLSWWLEIKDKEGQIVA